MAGRNCDVHNIPVLCYGLKTDFQGKLFEGARLFELADVIEEIPTICWCGKKAHFNARVVDGKSYGTANKSLWELMICMFRFAGSILCVAK